MYLHQVRSYTFLPTLHLQSASILITNLPCEDHHRLVLVADGSGLAPCTIAFHLKRFAHHCWCGEHCLLHVAKTSLLSMTEAKMEPRTARSKPRHTTICGASKRPRHSLYSVRGKIRNVLWCVPFRATRHSKPSLYLALATLLFGMAMAASRFASFDFFTPSSRLPFFGAHGSRSFTKVRQPSEKVLFEPSPAIKSIILVRCKIPFTHNRLWLQVALKGTSRTKRRFTLLLLPQVEAFSVLHRFWFFAARS